MYSVSPRPFSLTNIFSFSVTAQNETGLFKVCSGQLVETRSSQSICLMASLQDLFFLIDWKRLYRSVYNCVSLCIPSTVPNPLKLKDGSNYHTRFGCDCNPSFTLLSQKILNIWHIQIPFKNLYLQLLQIELVKSQNKRRSDWGGELTTFLSRM